MNENQRREELDMSGDEFRAIGHDLVDQLADLIAEIPHRPLTKGEPPSVIRQTLGTGPLPAIGEPADSLVRRTAEFLIEHSLYNGHPRFYGYITSSAAPIGALADLLAAVVNPNVGAWSLAPAATEIELQTIRWICELLGYPVDAGGALVSGGNMANFACFLVARKAKASVDVQKTGLSASAPMTMYVSKETHTWIEKASDEFGLGTNQVRWIPTDEDLRIRVDDLREAVAQDRDAGYHPFLVVGAAGSVGTGAIDPLNELADFCAAEDLWFHVDGAYGGFVAALPEAPDDMKALARADSVAVDPHKWLYTPLEAGCAIVRDAELLRDTFTYHPPYYRFDTVRGERVDSMSERSPQNSRGFRALKVWLGLRRSGREGVVRSIRTDIELSRHLQKILAARNDFEVFTQGLSIVTFRFVPPDTPSGVDRETYLNAINDAIEGDIQEGGEAYVSHHIIDGRFVLRACIVNFRTTESDLEMLVDVVARLGARAHEQLSASQT